MQKKLKFNYKRNVFILLIEQFTSFGVSFLIVVSIIVAFW